MSEKLQRQFADAAQKQAAGAWREAEAAYRAILKHAPGHIDAAANLAIVLGAEGRHEEALVYVEKALRGAPNAAPLHHRHALTLLRLGRNQEAEAVLRRALGADPALAEIQITYGQVLLARDAFEPARERFQAALVTDPGNPVASCLLGDTYRFEADYETACRCYDEALSRRPDHAQARWSRAMALLAAGDLARGWPAYEARFAAGITPKANLPMPEWRGQPLEGQRILVYGEQGIGDEIMFATCIADLAGQAKSVVLVCEPRLAPLFARSFPSVEVLGLRGVADTTVDPRSLADVWVPAGDLPRYLRRDWAAFEGAGAYLLPDAGALAKWRARYEVLGPGLKVGLSWRGGGSDLVRRRRSIALENLALVLGRKGVQLVNLQYGACADELAAVGRQGLAMADWNDADPLTDLDDFAAQVAALDLVVSIDNATVHMAGALAQQVWALLPTPADWRWMSARDDSPWYPGVRLFRQERPGDWAPVLARIGDALAERVRGLPPGRAA